jgi:hypothetical protein
MIKTIFATSIIALGLSAGTTAFAGQRTITAFGHEFTVNDAGPQETQTALAPRNAMESREVAVDGPSHRRTGSNR